MLKRKDYLKYGEEINRWIQSYFDRLEGLPVKSPVKPGSISNQLPDFAPEDGQHMEDIISDLEEIILPGITHWQHPNFHAYFPANSSVESVLAETVTSAIGAQCMIWDTSPAAAELEEKMMQWLIHALGLPKSWQGVIQDTASTATLVAVLSARERATGFNSNFRGVPPGLRVYCSADTHSSIDKAVAISGIGRNNLVKIPSTDKGGLDLGALEEAMDADKQNGLTPCCVIATMGTTGSLLFDPLEDMGRLCQKHGVWYHIDAAFAGIALLMPEFRHLGIGVELADSFVVNPHKWMFTNFDCTAYFVKDKDVLLKTFEIMPEYLKTQNRGQVNDYRDWGIQLGRRFRALKLWFVMRSYGMRGIKEVLRGHVKLTQYFADSLSKMPDLEVVTQSELNLCTFRLNPSEKQWSMEELNKVNESFLVAINKSGKAYLTHTKIGEIYVIRVVIGQTYVDKTHVNCLLSTIEACRREFV